MFAALGVKVTLLDQRPTLLDFVDREMIESLCFQLRQIGTVFRLGEKVVSVGLTGAGPCVRETGKRQERPRSGFAVRRRTAGNSDRSTWTLRG